MAIGAAMSGVLTLVIGVTEVLYVPLSLTWGGLVIRVPYLQVCIVCRLLGLRCCQEELALMVHKRVDVSLE